jgi:hypothetical protein
VLRAGFTEVLVTGIADRVDEGEAEPDGQPGEPDRGAAVRGAVDDQEEHGCHHDLRDQRGAAASPEHQPERPQEIRRQFPRHRSSFSRRDASVPMRVSRHTTRSIFDRYSIGSDDETRAARRRQTECTAELRTRRTRKVIPLAEKRPADRASGTHLRYTPSS